LNASFPAEDAGPLTDDAFLGGMFSALQPAHGFRAGIDSVLLAACVPAEEGTRLIEPGTGAGVAALCVAHRLEGTRITGLEIEPALAALARRNAARNGMAERITVLAGDIAAPPAGLQGASFDHAFVNPPFLEEGAALAAADESLDRARRSEAGALKVWLDFCLDQVAEGGTVTIVQRAERLGAMLSVLEARAGAVHVLPLWPRRGVAAKRVVVCARKGSRAPLSLLPGLVLHEADGRYTPEAEAILRQGAPLFIA
jgi:tRNA1(Val) A37 N6-methylase TrmN6